MGVLSTRNDISSALRVHSARSINQRERDRRKEKREEEIIRQEGRANINVQELHDLVARQP